MTAISAGQVEAMGPNAVGKCQAAGGAKANAGGSSAGAAASSAQGTSPGSGPGGVPGGTSKASAANAGQPPGKPVVVVDPNKSGWLLIALVDETGAPIPAEPYRVKLPNGKFVEGNLDAQGAVRIEGVDEAKCKVGFPQRDDAGWQGA